MQDVGCMMHETGQQGRIPSTLTPGKTVWVCGLQTNRFVMIEQIFNVCLRVI